jgi:hypothetical protein
MLRYRLLACAVLGAIASSGSPASAQILNIEKRRIERPVDDFAVGNFGVNFSYTNRSPTQQEPVRVLTTGLTSNVAYFTDHKAFMLMSDYQLLRINEGTIVDNGVTHLRVQIGQDRTLSYELLTQHQYDRPRGLRFRGLFGAGGRLRLFSAKIHSLTAGLGPLLERERWLHPVSRLAVDAYFVKANCYLSYRLELSETADLNAVVYYQVGHDGRVDVFRQRVSGEINVAAKIAGGFSLTATFVGAYETKPLVPIVPLIFATTSGVRLNF